MQQVLRKLESDLSLASMEKAATWSYVTLFVVTTL